jgi:hypothetical protein
MAEAKSIGANHAKAAESNEIKAAELNEPKEPEAHESIAVESNGNDAVESKKRKKVGDDNDDNVQQFCQAICDGNWMKGCYGDVSSGVWQF